jgi:hypothetical protein
MNFLDEFWLSATSCKIVWLNVHVGPASWVGYETKPLRENVTNTTHSKPSPNHFLLEAIQTKPNHLMNHPISNQSKKL